MATQRLTPARFEALYELAMKPGPVGYLDKRTATWLMDAGLIEWSETTNRYHVYRVTSAAWAALRDHMDYLEKRENEGRLYRSDFECSVSVNPDRYRAKLDAAENEDRPETAADLVAKVVTAVNGGDEIRADEARGDLRAELAALRAKRTATNAAEAAGIEIGDRVDLPDEGPAIVRALSMDHETPTVTLYLDADGSSTSMWLSTLARIIRADADAVQATEHAAERGLKVGTLVTGDLRGTPVRGRITRFYMSGDLGYGWDFRLSMAVVQDEVTNRPKYMDVTRLTAVDEDLSDLLAPRSWAERARDEVRAAEAAPAPLPSRPAGGSAIADAVERNRTPLPGTTLRRDMTWTRELPIGDGRTFPLSASIRLVPFAEDGSSDRFTVYYSRPGSFDWTTYRTADRALRAVERFAGEHDADPRWVRQ